MLSFINDKKIYTESKTEVLVLPVTCDGYKDYDLYKEFVELIPELDDFYNQLKETDSLELGQNMYLQTQEECRVDIFVTPILKSMEDSCSVSTIEIILDDIVELANQLGKKSFAIPALGSTLGSLDFETQVKPVFEQKLGAIEDIDFEVYC